MKLFSVVFVMFLLGGCATVSVPPDLAASMDLQNLSGPFVTRAFAERLALLFFQERYSKDIFIPRTPAKVEDGGDVWRVTAANALPLEPRTIRPFQLRIVIRKRNGEIVGIG
jgi:hypothetical protein